MLLISLVIILLLTLGLVERYRHQKNINSIKIRVNVNGVRGKSTVTRLITGILTEAGYKTVGKTTGTSARMIYWDKEEEKPILRQLQGPNIGEQKRVVAEAAQLGAEALVSECMAVNPDYQVIFQRDMLQANIGVIVNVLEDHMDVLGPTLDEVAQAFTATIPRIGRVIINQSPYVDYFKKVAEKRSTKVFVADNSRIPESFLRQFKYIVFPENASLALAVADALGIDEVTAFQGMLNAHPDPGALTVLPIGDIDSQAYFVNGFAANDATSTLNIWNRIKELGYPTDYPLVIMNCRADRVDRTEQFANSVLPYINMDLLMVIGETTDPIVEAYNKGKIPANGLRNLEGYTANEVFDQIKDHLKNRVIYGIGNIHGTAEPLIELFEELHRETAKIKVDQFVT